MNKFSELEYRRPEMAVIKKEAQALLKQLKKADSYERAREVFLRLDSFTEDAETMMSVASIRNTINLMDKFYETEIQTIKKGYAMLMPLFKKISIELCRTPFRPQLEDEFGKQFFRMTEPSIRLSSKKNIPLAIKQADLCNKYSKAVAACSADFRGEKCNFYGLLKHMESTDRDERREAAELWAKLYADVAPELDDLYDKLIANRCKQAKNLGFASYTEMAYLSRGRYDYGPEEAARFRSYVKKYITPAVDAAMKEQGKRLGVDTLRWYDEKLVYPEGNPTPKGTTEEKIAAAQQMYRELSAETGEFFDFMTENELFDLETRPNKHMGGYCTYLPKYKAPFIFSNFNGTAADVDVLTHEAGHAFQAYIAFRHQKLSAYLNSTSEINEIHSMAMEHLTYPWMNLFFGDDTKRRVYAHLSEALGVIPYLVSVDEFQHRVYEKPNMTHEERRACWREIEREYMPWRDYDGNEFLESGGYWMQKQHIFLYPFYYIDYALAQICAFMLYERAGKDRAAAWNDYMRLCRAGGSMGYFELLEYAGLDNPFCEESFASAVNFVCEELKKYES